MNLDKIKIVIKAHEVQLWGDLLSTIDYFADASNMHSILVAEHYNRVKGRLFLSLNTSKDITMQINVSEAIGIYTILKEDIKLNEQNKVYHPLIRRIVSDLHVALTNADILPAYEAVTAFKEIR